jgi:hypothetical protein
MGWFYCGGKKLTKWMLVNVTSNFVCHLLRKEPSPPPSPHHCAASASTRASAPPHSMRTGDCALRRSPVPFALIACAFATATGLAVDAGAGGCACIAPGDANVCRVPVTGPISTPKFIAKMRAAKMFTAVCGSIRLHGACNGLETPIACFKSRP